MLTVLLTKAIFIQDRANTITIHAIVSAFLSSRVSRRIISQLPTQQSQKLKSPLPKQALQRTKRKTKSTTVTIVRVFLLVTNACRNCQNTHKNLMFSWPCIIDINNIDNQLDATIMVYYS